MPKWSAVPLAPSLSNDKMDRTQYRSLTHTKQLVGFRIKMEELSLMLRIVPHYRCSCTLAVIYNLHTQKISRTRTVLTIPYSLVLLITDGHVTFDRFHGFDFSFRGTWESSGNDDLKSRSMLSPSLRATWKLTDAFTTLSLMML